MGDYDAGCVQVKLSTVVGACNAMLMLDRFMSAPDTAMEPSKRGSVALSKSSSSALPFRRNQPAVPATTPLKLHTPLFDTAPSAAVAKVSPLVAVPGVNAPEASVTVPSSVPVAAELAVTGCVPLRCKIGA